MERFLIFGLGNIALRHIKNIRYLYPKIKIAVVSSSKRAIDIDKYGIDIQLDSQKSIFDFDPEFVIIASPSSFHTEHYKKIYKLNIPILIEKPLASTIEDAQLAISLEDKNHDSTISLGYCLRYLPSLKIVKNILDEGRLGKIFNIQTEVGQYLPDWRSNKHYKETVSASKSLGGGALLELSHEFDYLFHLFGEMKLEYSAISNLGDLNLDIDEVSDIIFRTKSNAICYVHLDFYQRQPYRQCRIIGEAGRINWNLLDNSVELMTSGGTSTIYSDPDFDKNDMYISMLKDLVASHTKNLKSPIDLKSGYHVVKTISEIKNMAEYE